MDYTIIGQGSFTVGAAVVPVNIPLPSGVDWMYVYNFTQFGTNTPASATGVEFYWQTRKFLFNNLSTGYVLRYIRKFNSMGG